MASLLAGMERSLPRVPFAPRHLVRLLAGPRVADLLDVPASEGLHATVTLSRLLPRTAFVPFASMAHGVSRIVGRPLLDAVLAAKLGDEPATFAMPRET
jgi:hypothetical protein